MILQRLKTETRDLHDQIEANPLMSTLTSDAFSRAGYIKILQNFYRFFDAFEACILQFEAVRQFLPDIEERRKLPLIAADLAALGAPLPIEKFVSPALPETAAAAFGALYVTEGSTLGGQVILRHLQKHFPENSREVTRYFAGYGSATGAYWRAFKLATEAFCTSDRQASEIVSAARAAFESLDRMMH